MKSEVAGTPTLEVEVTQIDLKGIWLLLGDHEYFLPYEKFPTFEDSTVREIHNVRVVDNVELRWPDLDIIIAVDSFENGQHVPSD